MVPWEGLEPSRPYGQRILSPLRLPIPPPGQLGGKIGNAADLFAENKLSVSENREFSRRTALLPLIPLAARVPTRPDQLKMPTLPKSLDATASAHLSTATMQIARFRGSLDWMLALPAWEDCLGCSLSDLGFKGKRQGINQRNALRSLPIEQKQELVRHALENGLPRPSATEAKRLANLWGVTQYRARPDLSPPSEKQWQNLQSNILLRTSTRYEQYKNAQSDLFAKHQTIAIEGALAICSQPSQREDACQEARLALLEAIDRVDPSENFEAYARQWIKRRVLNFLMQERVPVKAPINLISKSLRGLPEANPVLQKAIREGTVRLDDVQSPPSQHDRNLSTQAKDSPDETASATDDSALIAYALSHLTEKQREVVELRFGLGNETHNQSLSQIAEKTGISRQQVFQREKRALIALRESLAPLAAERSFHASAQRSY